MTDTHNQFWGHPIGRMVPLDAKPAPAVPERRCESCRAVLSRYNPMTVCSPCHEAAIGPIKRAWLQ